MRRKLISSLLLFVLIFSAVSGLSGSRSAKAADTTVKVTISNAGNLVVTQESVKVTDADNDGKLTINDALIIIHTAKHPDGANGFASSVGDYGLSATKLWGVETTGIGYYVNNNSAWSLADELKDGDKLVAWLYADDTGWSDQYCYFDVDTKTVNAGTAFTLTLTGIGYDASWNLVPAPLAGATITVNGAATDVKTDAEGKATITVKNAGTAVISATSDVTIVPPVCVATVAAAPGTGVVPTALYILLLAVIAILAAFSFKKGFTNVKNN